MDSTNRNLVRSGLSVGENPWFEIETEVEIEDELELEEHEAIDDFINV